MAAAVSLATLILPLLPSAISDVSAIWTAIMGIRTATQQTGEWTADAEAAWQAALFADGKSGFWQPA